MTDTHTWSEEDAKEIERFNYINPNISRYFISFRKNLKFAPSAKFARDENLKDKKYVILSYHKKKNAIIFTFTNKKSNNTLAVNYDSYLDGCEICGKSFYNYFKPVDLDFKKYTPEKIDIPNLGKSFVIYLRKIY